MELCVHSLIGMDLIQFNHFDVSLIFRRCASHSNNFTEYQRMRFFFSMFSYYKETCTRFLYYEIARMKLFPVQQSFQPIVPTSDSYDHDGSYLA